MQFMNFVNKNYGHQKRFSWTRLNGVRDQALKFAIIHDLEFFKEDFTELADEWNIYKWGGKNGHMLGEHYYYYACGGKDGDVNMSACLSFEFWKKRKPFILKIFDKYDNLVRSQRLAVDVEFVWEGEHVTCTSFNEDGDKITACSYKDNQEYPVKVKNRYSIWHKDLQEYNKTVMDELRKLQPIKSESKNDKANY